MYDITQPVFGCRVYPGDPGPKKQTVCDINKGDLYNLTSFSMCAHNGTHIDAPLHFIEDGKSVDEIDLNRFIGPAYVDEFAGDIGADDAKAIMQKAKIAFEGAEKKILIKGKATVTSSAAKVFAEAGVELLGNESQTVGPEDAPMEVHLILLEAEIVVLEGIVLSEVPEGAYRLNCVPLNLNGAEGAPCRAILTDII